MTENDKSQVRAFLASEAAKVWLEEGRNGFEEMTLKDAKSDRLYDISLREGKGWRDAIKYLVRLVQPVRVEDHFGVMPIDPVRD
jgi:hypothetical protein